MLVTEADGLEQFGLCSALLPLFPQSPSGAVQGVIAAVQDATSENARKLEDLGVELRVVRAAGYPAGGRCGVSEAVNLIKHSASAYST